MSQNELAAIAGVAPITVARLVDRLEAQGLVERCTDPKDRRINAGRSAGPARYQALPH